MRVTRGVLVTLLVVLAATGVALLWLYHPDPDPNFNPAATDPWAWVRTVHRVSARMVELLAVIYLVAVVVRRRDRWRSSHAVGLVVLLSLFGFTGFLLPWEQLALRAVTVGVNVRGALAVLTEDVRFVLIGG